jgi:hypothetical protein
MKRFCATFLMLAALLAVSSLAYGDKGVKVRGDPVWSARGHNRSPRRSGHRYDREDQGEF